MLLKNLKLALVQMRSLIGNKDMNLKKMMKFIDQASEENADIICFPEMSLTGYSSEYGPENAICDDDPLVETVRNAARKKDVVIIFGFVERNGKDLPYLTQMITCPDGTSMKYRKTHLGMREDGRFARGNSIPVIKTENAVIGIALCWEAHIPEIFSVLRRNGAELIFLPHASNLGDGRRKETWMRYLPARAWDNDVYVAACNSIGNNGRGSVSGGGSIVLNRKGVVIFENFNDTESLDTVELNGFDRDEKPSDDMCNIKYFQERRPELY